MARYEKYKDTNLQWIGEIPDHWTLSRIGAYFDERSEKVDDVNFPALSVTMSGVVDQLSDVAKTDDGENRKLVRKDDFVINSRSDRKGSSGISPRDGSVSLINIVLKPKDIDPAYIQHLFKSYYFKEEFFRNGKGIHWDLWTTRWDQLKNINIPIPHPHEQRLIARYLDKKTQQIDTLIEKIEKKIELLKEQRTSLINQYVTKGLDPNVEMKDSGVEWIGKIPKHWESTRNKSFLTLKREIVGEGWRDYQLLSLGKAGVTIRDIESGKGKFPESFETYQVVNDGDFVFCLFDMDETPRTVGLSKFYGMITGAYSIFECSDAVNHEFIFFYYLVIDELKGLKPYYSGLRKTIRPSKFLSLHLYLPPRSEQDTIVERMKHEVARSSKLIDSEQRRVS